VSCASFGSDAALGEYRQKTLVSKHFTGRMLSKSRSILTRVVLKCPCRLRSSLIHSSLWQPEGKRQYGQNGVSVPGFMPTKNTSLPIGDPLQRNGLASGCSPVNRRIVSSSSSIVIMIETRRSLQIPGSSARLRMQRPTKRSDDLKGHRYFRGSPRTDPPNNADRQRG
jgi:hypothetical protein